jgi:hypothetical protein
MSKKEQTSTTPETRPTSNGWRTFGIIVITVVEEIEVKEGKLRIRLAK